MLDFHYNSILLSLIAPWIYCASDSLVFRVHRQISKLHVIVPRTNLAKAIVFHVGQDEFETLRSNLFLRRVGITDKMFYSLYNSGLNPVIHPTLFVPWVERWDISASLRCLLDIQFHSRCDLQSVGWFPEFWKSQSARSILVSNQVLPRRIDVPSLRPGPHRQGNFFSHETPSRINLNISSKSRCRQREGNWHEWNLPRNVRVEGNINQKFSPRKEETSGDERNLSWTRFVPLVTLSNIDANDGIGV